MKKKVKKKKNVRSKKEQKEIDDFLSRWSKEDEKREQHLKKATDSMKRWCKKYYKNPNEHIDGHVPLARALEHFDLEDSKEVGQLHLEWLVNDFAEKKVKDNIPDIDFIYQQLVANGYDEENRYEFNDMDNHLFYIPTDYIDKFKRRFKVFVMTTQNTNYLVVRKLHEGRGLGGEYDATCFYRYWDEYDFAPQDQWDIEEMNKFKEDGVSEAILHAEWITQRYSDNIPGRKYEPCRPDLKWYKENNFKSSLFGGHIIEIGEYGESNAAIFNFVHVKYAIFYLRFALGQCKGMENINAKKK